MKDNEGDKFRYIFTLRFSIFNYTFQIQTQYDIYFIKLY